MSKIYDLAYVTFNKQLMPPLSVIYGKDIGISRLLNNLISYYFPMINNIYDPTCGEENHQFKDYLVLRDNKYYYRLENNKLVEYIASDIKRTKWNCINDKCLIVDLFKYPYPFNDNQFDLIVYDPPFTVYARHDKRAKDYDIEQPRSISDIRRFYSEDIIKEFHRIVRVGIIIRGSDMYYPQTSDNLYLFLHDIIDIDMLRKWFKIVSVHIYRYFARMLPLARARMGLSLENNIRRRMFINHSYLIIAYKK